MNITHQHLSFVYLKPLMTRSVRFVVLLVTLSLSALHGQTDRTYRSPLPTQYDSTLAIEALRQRMDQIFSSSAYNNSKVSVMVWSITQNKPVYSRNSTTALTPASTTKLFSTASYYQHVGSGAFIATDVVTDGTVSADGTVHGNIYLVGHGDALLSVNDLEDLADQLRISGIKRITGNVYGDGSAFDGQTNRAVYSGDYEDVQPLPPIVALTVNKGTIVVVASASGRNVNYQTIPSSSTVVLVRKSTAARPAPPPQTSKTKTKSKKQSSSKSVQRKTSRSRAKSARRGDALPLPVMRNRNRKGNRKYAPRLAAYSSVLPDGTQQIVVSGAPRANSSISVYVTMARPALTTAGVFAERLKTGGIDIGGTIGERKAPYQSKRIGQFKRPFVDFASIVNKRSDNYLAEHVFKMVGALCGETGNTAIRAKRALLESLDSLGVARHGCSFNDGSGLSRRNVVSAATEVDLLRKIYQQPWGNEYRSTLAVGAYDGTIRNRMHNSPAANNVTAKTGTLRNVSALAGYVTTRDGELLAFSFISNGPYVGAYKGSENLAAIALASFSYQQRVPLLPNDVLPNAKTKDVEDEEE